jgi:hypothetical protein
MGSRAMTTLAESEDRLFTASRIAFFGSAVVLLHLAILAALAVSGGWFIDQNGTPTSIDFSFFWVSGGFAASSDPAAVYDYTAFGAAQRALYGTRPGGFPYYHFIYPPTFLFFTYPLGLLPYFVGFGVWLGGSFLLYEIAACAIVPRSATAIAAAAPIAVLHNAQAGHNGFLTAGLIGMSLVTMERRPVVSGILLGLATYKPQFGILFPIALIAARQWCVIIAAGATVVGLTILAAILFDANVWNAYIDTVRGLDGRLSPDPPQVELLHQSVFGFLHWSGAALAVSWVVHAIAATLIAAVVCVLWFRPTRYSLKASALCVGAVAITPYVIGYDLCILSIAVAFLVEDGLSYGFRPGERSLLLICFVVSVFSFYLRVPMGPFVSLSVLAIVSLRAWLPGAAAPTAPSM